MTYWTGAVLAALLSVVSSTAGAAVDCDVQRKFFPKNWAAVDKETPLFRCRNRYIDLKIFLSQRDETQAMLTVVNDAKVYRAIVDLRAADAVRRQSGLYILNSEKTCFIRGVYSQPAVLHFGDKAPLSPGNFLFAVNRLDAFAGCEPVK
jgi:hypothetical protein